VSIVANLPITEVEGHYLVFHQVFHTRGGVS
jgi:hypothetical protein